MLYRYDLGLAKLEFAGLSAQIQLYQEALDANDYGHLLYQPIKEHFDREGSMEKKSFFPVVHDTVCKESGVSIRIN